MAFYLETDHEIVLLFTQLVKRKAKFYICEGAGEASLKHIKEGYICLSMDVYDSIYKITLNLEITIFYKMPEVYLETLMDEKIEEEFERML